MTLLLVEGFDDYASIADLAANYPASHASFGVGSDDEYHPTGGISGGGALRKLSDSTPMNIRLPSNSDSSLWHIRVMMWVKVEDTNSNDEYFIQIGAAGASNTRHFQLDMPSGLIKVSWTENWTGIPITSMTINDAQWHHLEIYLSRSSLEETTKMWIDGILQIDAARGAGAAGNFNTPFNEVALFGADTNIWFDDLIVWNDDGTDFTGRKGILQIETAAPTADGTTREWTPSSGTDHFAIADNSAGGAGDAETLTASGSGIEDFFTYAPFAGAGEHVDTLVVTARVQADAGPGAQLKARARIGGSDYDASSPVPLPVFFGSRQMYSFRNPATGAAWTKTDVNTAEIGIETVQI